MRLEMKQTSQLHDCANEAASGAEQIEREADQGIESKRKLQDLEELERWRNIDMENRQQSCYRQRNDATNATDSQQKPRSSVCHPFSNAEHPALEFCSTSLTR